MTKIKRAMISSKRRNIVCIIHEKKIFEEQIWNIERIWCKKWEKYDWNMHLWGRNMKRKTEDILCKNGRNVIGIFTSGLEIWKEKQKKYGAENGRNMIGIFTSGVSCIILPSTLGSSLQAAASNWGA